MRFFVLIATFFLLSNPAHASYGLPELINHWVGITALVIISIAYTLVILEEKINLRKSKPMMVSAGLIWCLLAIVYGNLGYSDEVEKAVRHNFLEYAELFFFLLVAMTYINAMLERGVFDALRGWLINRSYSYRALFWMTGILAFFISPIADNLTTALILCAVVMAVDRDNSKFIMLSCINIVVGANAGGAFSPFGDITTLMVWQKNIIEFSEFFNLFIPSVVNFLVPALIMQYAVPKGRPNAVGKLDVEIQKGGMVIVILFLLTIMTAVSFHTYLHLPPVIGMMMGLAYLKMFGYYLKKQSTHYMGSIEAPPGSHETKPYDIFDRISQAEWDTLFFFYGVILSVGGLGFIGYLSVASNYMYIDLGPTTANILVGVMSAIIDNIPVMFAVLSMNPDMSHMQWLLVTLTAGVGGSMLSIGSAAGVALMGQARGSYTFLGHLKWSPVIALGYAASIYTHFLVNG